MTITSCGPISASAAVARNPWPITPATSALVTSSTCDRPAISPRAISALVS